MCAVRLLKEAWAESRAKHDVFQILQSDWFAAIAATWNKSHIGNSPGLLLSREGVAPRGYMSPWQHDNYSVDAAAMFSFHRPLKCAVTSCTFNSEVQAFSEMTEMTDGPGTVVAHAAAMNA